MNANQVEDYLARFRYAGPRSRTAETLDALIRAHIAGVPFENLDVYERHLVPSLQIPDLYYKIVNRRRGGYCFELNTLFADLLRSLGFPVTEVAARILVGRAEAPLSHKGLIAEAEGKRSFCDVGFGGPGPKGLIQLTEGEQTVNGGLYRFLIRGDDIRMQRKAGSDWENVMQFDDRPFPTCDFELLNFYCARCEKVLFTRERVVNLALPDGSKALTGKHLTIRQSGKVTEHDCDSDEELKYILQAEFGLA